MVETKGITSHSGRQMLYRSNKKLIEYVHSNLAHEVSPKAIRNALRQSHYSEDAIDMAFNEVAATDVRLSRKLYSLAWILSSVIVILLVIVAGLFVHLTTELGKPPKIVVQKEKILVPINETPKEHDVIYSEYYQTFAQQRQEFCGINCDSCFSCEDSCSTTCSSCWDCYRTGGTDETCAPLCTRGGEQSCWKCEEQCDTGCSSCNTCRLDGFQINIENATIDQNMTSPNQSNATVEKFY